MQIIVINFCLKIKITSLKNWPLKNALNQLIFFGIAIIVIPIFSSSKLAISVIPIFSSSKLAISVIAIFLSRNSNYCNCNFFLQNLNYCDCNCNFISRLQFFGNYNYSNRNFFEIAITAIPILFIITIILTAISIFFRNCSYCNCNFFSKLQYCNCNRKFFSKLKLLQLSILFQNCNYCNPQFFFEITMIATAIFFLISTIAIAIPSKLQLLQLQFFSYFQLLQF